ncbi:hypothetical protein E2562_010835 [Oryza meyeriana var. granulata]|uniref:DUF4220 domain-containing protein n=1 Tax=Oryza meyeriana var. granulata TaxID=110450 RepID=A0A6G1BJV3_9ORYZ|nr:hypothetical protein E2562_010835 [Oryza meyeriana var. granulata]
MSIAAETGRVSALPDKLRHRISVTLNFSHFAHLLRPSFGSGGTLQTGRSVGEHELQSPAHGGHPICNHSPCGLCMTECNVRVTDLGIVTYYLVLLTGFKYQRVRDDERQALHGQTHQLTFFWAPFLLIHLGGQDTVTAFSIEDNELWLRHLLNLLAHVWLALYVFWKSTPPGDRLVVPAIFVFVAGVIKYGERTWALKSGSENALRSSTTGNEVVKQVVRVGAEEANLQYSKIVKCALCSEAGVRDVFAGRKLHQLDSEALEKLTNNVAFEGLEDGEVHFRAGA